MILIVVLAQDITRTSTLAVAMDVLLGIGYLALFWTSNGWLVRNRERAAAVALLWLLTAFSWIIFGGYKSTVVLVFYLVGYMALRLSGSLSVGMAAAVILADLVIWLYTPQADLREIVMYAIIYTGMYGFLWGTRTRREANEIRKQHFNELSEMHAQLEQAHQELQLTHKGLEEATVRSLRYAVLEERTRIARDIHDSIGHGLTSVIVQLQALPYMIKTNPSEADNTLSNVLDVSRRCLTEVRAVVHQMAADDAGLGLLALRSLIRLVQEQSGLRISISITGTTDPWKPEISELLYRVLQEALTNVIRHAEATNVEVSVTESRKEIAMTIKDDGLFTGEAPPVAGFGLSGMRARSERAGGSFFMQTRQPHGLMLTVKVPLDNEGKEDEAVEK
ncbi:sensor histidine kinase [Paenibacillus sp. N3.4]|uniref:sensor histidine kinase n=1 Tax=Paenibacillus sp. N3.4 TaxID=2603222 RepID=UPI0016505583|nr:sensor histidine kinase [Paenibacillus sp. N3.4]